MWYAITLFLCLCVKSVLYVPPSPPSTPMELRITVVSNIEFPNQNKVFNLFLVKSNLPTNIFTFKHITLNLIKIIFLSLLWVCLIFPEVYTFNVRYVTLNTNISVFPKYLVKQTCASHTFQMFVYIYTYFSLFELFLVIFILDKSFLKYLPDVHTLIILKCRFYSNIHRLCFSFYKFNIRFLFYTVHSLLNFPNATLWYYQLVISLSNDVSENPGPIHIDQEADSPYFSFCNWNLNTLSKNGFSRLSLLQAHNLHHKYDIISLCETSLGLDEIVPSNIIQGYQYHPCNHPSGEKRGGVGILCKDTLAIKIRNDLSFDECLVAELKIDKKKIFFTVLYRNPIHKANSFEFLSFMDNLSDLHSKIVIENPYLIIFTGDFNAHSIHWWPEGDNNNEGTQLNILFSELGLTQLISEPTHFRDLCQPTCIDLIICDEPNMVMESGVRPSLDPSCKHQITYCIVRIKNAKILPHKRKVWKYDKANKELIDRAITEFPWASHLNKLPNPNSQVEFLNKTIMNIINNFVPSSSFTTKIDEPKWMTRDIKNLLRKQKKIYKRYRINGFNENGKIKMDDIKKNAFNQLQLLRRNI